MAELGSVLAIGGSAGCLDPLVELVQGLPDDFAGCVLVTVHINEGARSNLSRILSRAGRLAADPVRDGQRLRPGRIFVAPPGFHLLAVDGVARLSAGPRVNRYRPSVDVMLASAARWARDRVVAVVLSGALDDGAVGAALVAQSGGRLVVQEPEEAIFGSMPRAVLAAAPAATAVSAARLGEVVSEMMGADMEPVPPEREGRMTTGLDMAHGDDPRYLAVNESSLTCLTCPDCGGVLAQVDLPRISYYRCHVGHQYGPQTLHAAQGESAEAKLWSAVAALEEHAAMARHLAEQCVGHDQDAGHDGHAADGYLRTAQRSTDLAESVRTQLQPPGNGSEFSTTQATK